MKNLIYLFSIMICLSSCKDVLDAEEVENFSVSTTKSVFKVGEQISFTITGNPKLINFYSGQFGNDYDSISGRMVSPGDIEFSFNLRYNYPTRTASEFAVLVSSDFEGERTSLADVNAATWTDITDRCIIKREDAYISSGIVNVSDLVVEGKPLHFAFKYIFDPKKGSAGSVMWINTVLVTSTTENGKQTLSSSLLNDFPLYAAVSKDKNPYRSDNRSTNLVMWNNANSTVEGITYTNTTYTEEYFVSKGYPAGLSVDNGPDKPITIKAYSDARIGDFQYVFDKAGTYKVVFEAMNTSVNGEKKLIKEINLTIEE